MTHHSPKPSRRQGRRIAFVVARLAQRSGGAERVLIETANALAWRGHQVEIITHERGSEAPFYPLGPGVRLSNLRPRQRPAWHDPVGRVRSLLERAPDVPVADRLAWVSRHAGFARRLGAHLHVTEPDVAVAFLPPACTALALAKAPPSLRRIASLHNVPEQDFANPERWDGSRYGCQRRLALLSRFDGITVLLPEFRDWFAPELRPSITVMPNAIAPVAPPLLTGARREPVVLAVGRLASVKRHDLLIEAWSRIAARFPNWSLRIFGEGPLRHELETKIDAAALPSVQLMGHTPHIAETYLSSAILAHPAEFEGFGLAPAEALAAGLPVVGFEDCSGINMLVQDGSNGVLVSAQGDRVANLADALAGLMGDDARRLALGAAGPSSVARYAPSVIIDMWEDLLFEEHLSVGADEIH